MSESTTETTASVVEPEQVGTVELTETEQTATEHGWNQEGVEGKRNLSAEEFMDRQGLYDDIRSLKKNNRKLQDGIEAMKQMQQGIRDREREKTINELNAQKKTALENENYDAVVAIDDRIAQERVVENAPVSNEAFEQWIDNNDWYHQDGDMKDYADMIGAGYAQQHPNKPVADVYKYVEKEVKSRFADKFENSNRSKPNPVEGASRGRSQSGGMKHTARDLPEQDRQIMKTIVRTGAMSEADYLKEYFA